jgi:hypothetical protein
MANQGRFHRFSVAMLLGALLLSGCQNMGDTRTTQTQGAVGGAVAGALAGGLIGKSAAGALIGTAIGALLGFGAGSAIAENKEQYANTEAIYDAAIARTLENNRQMARYNDELSYEVSGYQMEINNLYTLAQSGSVDRDAAQRTHNLVLASYAGSSRTLAEAMDELKVQEQVALEMGRTGTADASRAQMQLEQVSALSGHIDVLRQQVETLASQSNQLQQFR